MLKNLVETITFKAKLYFRYFLIIASIFLSVSLVRNIIGIREAAKRIDEARSRVEILKEENAELQATLSEIESEAFMERQLRDSLGLTREGETLVVLPDNEEIMKFSHPEPREIPKLPDPNWKLWLNLF